MLLRLGLRSTFSNLTTPSSSSSAASSFLSSSPLSTGATILRRLSTHTRVHARPRTRTLALPISRRSPLLISTTLALSSGLLLPQCFAYPTRNDSSPYSHGRDAKTPLSADGGKSLNPAAVRQISMGAVLGLGLGVVFSALSRMLVLVLGVGIVVWQYAARRGYNFIPVDRMQRYVKGINLRSAINDNAAFKISFGLMFALTAFGEF